MHIAFLTPEYPHVKINHSGGLGTSIKNLVLALVAKGEKVSVFIYSQPKTEIFEENGITFHLIANKKYKFAKWFFYRKHIQNYVKHYIVRDKIEIVETPDWTGITAFMRFPIPVVLRFHGSDTYFCHIEKRKQKFKNKIFETLAVRSAQAYIAPTNFAGILSAQLFKINPAIVRTIHYGLDLKAFNNPEPQEYHQGLILYVGTIIRKKGVFELPEIFEKVLTIHPNAQLVLIGSDSADIQTNSPSTWELVQTQFSAKALQHVTYLGKMPYHEVKEYIKKANVCVFPTYAETLGMVTIESMAMQKPVVNSNIGWAQELMVDGESGFLVHPSNHDLYAKCIESVLNDSNLTLQIGKKAHQYVAATFDIEQQVVKNISFYKNVLDHAH